MILNIKKSFHKLLVLLLPLILLSACQSIPSYVPLSQHKTDSSAGIKHEFLLVKDQSVFGQLGEIEVESDDSLPLIARYFGLGFDEITNANPQIDPWLPDSSSTVKLPSRFILPSAQRKGLVLNLASKRLFYFPKNKANKVVTFPIGIGRTGWLTPKGKTRIVAKKAHPNWVVPKSILKEHSEKGDPLPKVVKAGPNNPLGDYAIRLGIPGYLIHGTNKPYGVGMAVSHGCVRLYPEHIELLFNQVSTGTKVQLIHQPFLIGWDNQELYIQVYPRSQINKKQNKKLLKTFRKKLKAIAGKSKRLIAWNKVETAITQANGITVAIFKDHLNNEAVTQYKHPKDLNLQIKPPALINKSWRIKVAEFSEENSAQRLAVMLNHQGPPIPSHALSTDLGYIVVAGPFNTLKKAKSAIARLRIDFELDSKLIERGKNIAKIQNKQSILSDLMSVLDL